MRKVSPEPSNRSSVSTERSSRTTRTGCFGRQFPAAPDPDREVEVVIVGGGAGGLTAAYRLRDRNLLLLEALPRLGGNSMYFEWEGMPFSLGGQVHRNARSWANPVWELCGELNLQPEKDTSPLAVVFPGNVQIEDPYSLSGLLRMPIPWRVKRDIAEVSTSGTCRGSRSRPARTSSTAFRPRRSSPVLAGIPGPGTRSSPSPTRQPFETLTHPPTTRSSPPRSRTTPEMRGSLRFRGAWG